MASAFPRLTALAPGFDSPEDYLRQLIAFVQQYEWLTQLHSVDFFIDRQWDLFNPEWQAALLPSPGQSDEAWLAWLLCLGSPEAREDHGLPASLQHFLDQTRVLGLPRAPFHGGDVSTTKINKTMNFGMNDKKMHEVYLMGQLIKEVAQERGISNILDLGSGQGYLARVLAYEHGLNVLAVDKSEVQIRGAEKFDSRTSRGRTGQMIPPDAEPNLKHLTQTITPDNISDVLTGHEQDAHPNGRWLITGLHACGDLSTLILRLFVQDTSKVKALVNVGCCYHCLTEDDEPSGFPMSDFVKAQRYRMGTTNRVLACHSPSRWYQEKADTLKAFELHFYRALMQSMLNEKGLASPTTTVVLGRIKTRKDFGAYVAMALKKLGLAPETISIEEAEARYRHAREQQEDKKLMALWTVRALLGPLLESIVLVDRWMYLKQNSEKEDEQSWGAWMYPLFDASASPRNVVFVAYKQ